MLLQVRRHKVTEMGSARARAIKAAHEVKLRRQEEVAREAEHHKALQASLAHQRALEMDKKRIFAYRRQCAFLAEMCCVQASITIPLPQPYILHGMHSRQQQPQLRLADIAAGNFFLVECTTIFARWQLMMRPTRNF